MNTLTVSRVIAEKRWLQEEMRHLRSGEHREWISFPEQASAQRLDIEFTAHKNAEPHSLGLRRIDVKQGWRIELNGQRLADLFSDENDMQEVWLLPPGSLLDGVNQLTIAPTSERVDDISIGQIWLDSRPLSAVLGEATLEVCTRDATGQPLPCRFTILDDQGAMAAIGLSSTEEWAVRSGVVYTASGCARIPLASGRYTVLAGRGFEYSLSQTSIELERGDRVEREFVLQRVVDTTGLVACDPHVHTFEVSRHGDASLVERMITLAGEGIELPIATDHNVFVDYRPWLERLKLQSYMTPIMGNEVTTPNGHFNIFPATSDATPPQHKTGDWETLFSEIYATPNIRVAILNHPRDVHYGFEPFAPQHMIAAVGQRRDQRILRANAVELINSAALQSNPLVVFHDWQTQINRGLSLTAVGTSDSHEVSRKIVGQGRTYLYMDDREPGSLNIDEAVECFLSGRALVSLGLLTELDVNSRARSGEVPQLTDEPLTAAISVKGPEWSSCNVVQLYMNGQLVRERRLNDPESSAAGLKAELVWEIDRPKQDVQLVALALGPGVEGLHWPIAKAYQPTTPHWQPYVFGSSGVVRVVVDGDGHWTPPLEYARRAVDAAGGQLPSLLQQLQPFDEPTAAFAAHLWTAAGGNLRQPAAQSRIAGAAEHVRHGFERYLLSERESLASEL